MAEQKSKTVQPQQTDLANKLKNTASGALAKNEENALVPKNDMFRNFMEKHRAEFEMVIPSQIKPDRLIALATVACSRSPKLLECTIPTIFGGLLQAMALGFEVNSPLHEAVLVPFKNNKTKKTEAQLIIEYRGYITLFNNHPKVITVFASEVYENDTFSYSYGIDEKLHHIPCEQKEKGKMRGAYAYAKLKDGGFRFVFLPLHRIEEVRDEYSTGYANDKEKSPWVTDFAAMACKTAIRRLEKFVPKSAEAAKAVEADYHVVDVQNANDRNGIRV